ncbi:MAG: DUF84 family protein [Candidatus Micrarchaeia archaeon]
MKIAIGTTNKLKVDAIKGVLGKIFPDAEFIPTKVESGVSEDPKSEEEGINGALNRALKAMEIEGADIGVGPEGITATNSYGTFVYGYVAIVDKAGAKGIGASAQVMLPKRVVELMSAGKGLAEAMSELSSNSKEEIRTELGTNGILTNGMYDRSKEFTDATTCAVARFVSKFYE